MIPNDRVYNGLLKSFLGVEAEFGLPTKPL